MGKAIGVRDESVEALQVQQDGAAADSVFANYFEFMLRMTRPGPAAPPGPPP